MTYNSLTNANLINAQSPAFHLHAGDISYAEDGGDGLITDTYDPQVWDTFLNQVEPVASSVPWQIAAGNHEMETWYSPDGYGGLFDRFALPGSTTYYSFVYGNVMVISLDANDVSNEFPANNGYTGGAQTTWLATQLAAARSRVGHRLRRCVLPPLRLLHVHGARVRGRRPRQLDGVVRPVLGRPRDQRPQPHLRADRPDQGWRRDHIRPDRSTITPATQGTTYVTAGAGGESLYNFSAPDSYEGNVNNDSAVACYINEPGGTTTDETVAWSRVRFTGYCLLVVESTPAFFGGTSQLNVRGLSEDGTELDRFTLARKSH